jgi:hypothetical protein
MQIASTSVSAATTDSGPDMVKGMQLLKKRRVPCGTHGGQKVLGNAFESLEATTCFCKE